jgi:hypothetical protein
MKALRDLTGSKVRAMAKGRNWLLDELMFVQMLEIEERRENINMWNKALRLLDSTRPILI